MVKNILFNLARSNKSSLTWEEDFLVDDEAAPKVVQFEFDPETMHW